MTLVQLAEQTNLSKSALGSYEADDFKDISHYTLIKLTKFYGVTTDYLLGLSEMKQDLEKVASFMGRRLEQWLLIYCKQNHLPYNRLTEEEKQWLIRIGSKSDFLKSHTTQREKTETVIGW